MREGNYVVATTPSAQKAISMKITNSMIPKLGMSTSVRLHYFMCQFFCLQYCFLQKQFSRNIQVILKNFRIVYKTISSSHFRKMRQIDKQ